MKLPPEIRNAAIRAARMQLFKNPFATRTDIANAILKALETALKDYVILPREPTKGMLKAAAKAMSPEHRPTKSRVSVREKHRIRYKAMIKAHEER